ncbi:hypothetical protein BCR36DRAFT_292216 [Piromyces finnis]|uniref:Chitin-binding type-1 domain-containing protein n=1 Tax=Piromyces finnis TaxID=1754191 RepID=A0A1Y1V8I3_9FUNG|nr:hypothetical protein BCR36DRAFT_292216 [Piromyces finnis]|eukprot:ORX49023.1 hypothetical protein BCR36DRAFT_292216 [Piromyces finnis]
MSDSLCLGLFPSGNEGEIRVNLNECNTNTNDQHWEITTKLPDDGRCGKDFRKSCPNGQCCSKYGWCGTTKDYCSTGCQKSYGTCK